MILSQQQIMSDKQEVTASALSTNVIDLKKAGVPYGAVGLESDMGKGEPVGLLISVNKDVLAAGSATVDIALEVSDNEDMSSSTVVYSTGAVAKADLVKGYKIPFRTLPVGVNKQYLAVRYTVATGPLTAGEFTAALTNGDNGSWNT